MQLSMNMITRDYSEGSNNPGVIYATVRFAGQSNELLVLPMSYAQAQQLDFQSSYQVDIGIPDPIQPNVPVSGS